MKKIALALIIIISCSFKGLHNESETGFSKVCLELAVEFSNYDHGHLVYNERENKYVQSKDFSEVLQNISRYDLKKTATYQVESKDTLTIKQMIWTDKKNNNMIRFKKRVFTATGNKCKGLTITDYYINTKQQPTYIHLRLIGREFEELTIDQTIYHSFFESRLVGADEALLELQSREK